MTHVRGRIGPKGKIDHNAPMLGVSDPPQVTVTIEIPRWSFVKYSITDAGGHIDFISPLPCPFNYGFVPGTVAEDAMPLDVVVLGPRLKRGTHVTMPVRAIVRFVDNDQLDDKLICCVNRLTPANRLVLHVGFRIYVLMKKVRSTFRRLTGRTEFYGLTLDESEVAEFVHTSILPLTYIGRGP